MQKFDLLIDGRSREGARGHREPVVNPATGLAIGTVAYAEPADLDNALAAAMRGMREWSAVSPWQRGAILKRAADILRNDLEVNARALTLEQGKPLEEARAEVTRSAEFLEWAGEQGRRITGRTMPGRDGNNRIEIETHPVGIVAAFTPWNFPMALAAKKFAGALGAGCAIVCKPSEETPGSVLALARALLAAGVPAGALAVVYGQAEMISSHLIAAAPVAKITFTGSIPVGKLLAAAAGRVMKPVTMELGGHAPVIVCADADPEAAAEALARAKFANAGQICLSPTRFFVEAPIIERFTARFIECARAWRVGDGMDAQTQMGPLANARRVDAIASLVEDARAQGAVVAAGGSRIGQRGFFFAPTVLTDIPAQAQILHLEPFGPIAPIIEFTDEQAMLASANALEFGLSGYVFTHDAVRQRRLADALHAGSIGINHFITHLPEVPLGGWKDSGYGTEGGVEILAPYQKTKFVSRV